MKIAPANLAMGALLRQTASLIVSLAQTKTVLFSLEKQDTASAELYRLLRLQNQLLLQRLCFLQAAWNRVPPENLPMIQLELQTLPALAQVHCQVVGWLAGGEDLQGGPKFDLPDSTGSTVPASVDLN